MKRRCMIVMALAMATSFLLANPTRGQMIDETEDFSYDGFLEADHDVMVAAVEIGRLETVLIKVGDRVEAGQEIATLENAAQVIAVEIAKLQTANRGEFDAAVAERNMHVTRTEQLRLLAAMGTARPDELTRAEVDLQIAEARVQIVMEEQQSQLLELRRQEVQLERRRILSPLSGVVAKVLHQPGEYISPGDTAIARIIAKDTLIAVFNLPAADAMQLRIDQKVPVRPRTVPRFVQGVVESIAPAIDGESGTVGVRIRVDNRDEALLPGDRCLLANVRQLPAESQAVRRPQILRLMTR
jgi:RND family efflux transporter MFP subunit